MRREGLVLALVLGSLGLFWLGPARPRERGVIAVPRLEASGATARGPELHDPPQPARGERSAALAAEGSAPRVRADPPSSVPLLQVRFVDADALALAGVELLVEGRESSPARSDPGGVARLAIESSIGPLVLVARAPGFATARRRLPAFPEDGTWLEDWTLSPAGTVTGRVLDENGRALAGVRVGVADRRASRPLRSTEHEETRSASDGTFTLAAIPGGPLRLCASAEGRAPALSAPLEVPRGGRIDGLEIRLEAPGSATELDGIVLTPSGTPAAFAAVDVQTTGTSYRLRAGADGTFRIDPGRGTRCRIVASDPEGRHGAAILDDVPAGSRELELRLVRTSAIELVVSAAGGPVEHFGVVLRNGNEDLSTFPEAPRPGGRLSLARPPSPFRIEVHANGWRPARLGPFQPGAAPASIECSLEPVRGVSGRVLHAERPVAGAIVQLFAAAATATVHNGFPVRNELQAFRRTESTADGHFALSVEVAGDYLLRAELAGFAPTEIGPLALVPDVSHEVDLVLGPGGALAVRVRSRSKQGVAGSLVALSRGDGRARTWHCDGNGERLIGGLTPGPWQVELAEAEIDPYSGTTRPGTGPVRAIPFNCIVREGRTTRVDLWLEDRGSRACRLSGRLMLDGEPARGFVAQLSSESASTATVSLDRDGAFRIAADEPGPYTLLLASAEPEARRMLVVHEELELFEGDRFWSADLETGRLDLVLPVTMTLQAGEQLYQHWSSGRLEVHAALVPDADGRIRHDRAPLGPARLVGLRLDRSIQDQVARDLGALEALPREGR